MVLHSLSQCPKSLGDLGLSFSQKVFAESLQYAGHLAGAKDLGVKKTGMDEGTEVLDTEILRV
jgi:hypothetical protein